MQQVSASEQISIFQQQQNKDFNVGEYCYLISIAWLKKWKEFVDFNNSGKKSSVCPPIDNSDLLKNGEINESLIIGFDYQMLHKEMWDLFVSWYGGGDEIKVEIEYDPVNQQNVHILKQLKLKILFNENSYTVNISKYKPISFLKKMICKMLELNPTDYSLYVVSNNSSKIMLKEQLTVIQQSIHEETILALAKNHTSKSTQNKNGNVNHQKSNSEKKDNTCINHNSKGQSDKELFITQKNEDQGISLSQKTDDENLFQNQEKNDKKLLIKQQNEDKKSLHEQEENEDEFLLKQTKEDKKLLLANEKNGKASLTEQKNTKESPIHQVKNDKVAKFDQEKIVQTNGTNSILMQNRKRESFGSIPLSKSVPHSLNKANYSKLTSSSNIGVCGFANLGNTCFLSSSLQCLIHTMPFVRHFTEEDWKSEISMNNKLGTHGMCASAFATIADCVWKGASISITPKSIATIISRYSTSFDIQVQQDAHEFTLLLLDMIHEDLNRVQEKPVVESIEGNGENDEEVAEEAWKRYKSRNDSIVVDTFHGLLRSKLKCPSCNLTTVIFDPFVSISLQIPPPQMQFPVQFIPYDPLEPQLSLNLLLYPNSPEENIKHDIFEQINRSCRLVYASITESFSSIEIEPNLYQFKKNAKLYAFEIPENENGYYAIAQLGVKIKKFINSSSKLFRDLYIIEIPNENPTQEELIEKAMKRFQYLWSNDVNNGARINEKKRIKEALHQKEIISFGDSYFKIKSDCKGKFPPHKKVPFISIAKAKITINGKYMNERYHFNLGYLCRPICNELSQTKLPSLESCLKAFLSNGILDEDNQWYCPKCKKFVCANKKLDFWSLPKCLIINFKRFVFIQNKYKKNNAKINFPNEIDLSNYVCNPQENQSKLIYRIYAVIHHQGSLSLGHYTAHVYIESKNQWYFFNDTVIKESNINQIHLPSAYILFYERISI